MLSAIRQFFSHGDWAAWANNLITTAALIAAVVAARSVHRLERQRDEQARDDAARAQAVCVSGWCGQYFTELDVNHEPINERWHMFVRNASELPVYDVDITFQFPSRVVGGEPAADAEWMERGQMGFPFVPPGDTTRCPLPDHMLGQVGPNDAGHFRPSLIFSDAAGRHWQRDRSGILTSLAKR